MNISTSHVITGQATPLIRRLCKHWAHKFPVTYDDLHGDIQLSYGHCLLQVGEGNLEVRLEAENAEHLERLERVVAEHLQRMALKETLAFEWQHETG